jgi:ADP-heptose:LPS heptosyltransferase
MSFKSVDQAIRGWNHRRIDFLRRFRLQVTKKFFDHRAYLVREKNSGDNVLVFRLDDKLGDAVVSTGFLKSIKSNFIGSKLIVLAGPQTSEIYRSLSFVDEVVVCKKGFLSLLKCYRYLKKNSYRYIINTSHILSPRVVMLLSALKASAKLGFLNSDYKLFSATALYDEHKHHVLVRYRNLVELMGVTEPELGYVLEVKKQPLEKAMRSLDSLKKQGKKIILLNSFAGARLRNFSKETTHRIIRGLTDDSSNVVISVANDGDHRIVAEWREGSNLPSWIQMTDFSSLEDNVALLSQADLVITPDTAWVHLASALGRNLVAVYREDTEEKNSVIWAPAHQNAKVVIAPQKPESPYDINNVSVDEVIAAAKAFLS